MKATGIVRRIDDLHRVVIPKEICKVLHIIEGDPLEIFLDDRQIILQKYSPVGALGDLAKEYTDSLYESIGHIACIADRDKIIAVSGGSKKEFLDKSVDLYGNVINQKTVFEDRTVFAPIIVDGEVVGAVILLADKTYLGKFTDVELKMAKIVANLLAKQVGSY